MTRYRILLPFLFSLVLSARLPAQESSPCLECHGEEGLTAVDENGEEASIYVSHEVYSESAHGMLYCTDCHSDLEGGEYGHDVPVEHVNCADCHGDVQDTFAESIHGELLTLGDKDVPDCASCHGKHDIFPAGDDRSTVNKFNLMYTCAKCHQNEDLKAKRDFSRPDALPQFYESVHARGLLEDGLVVAPSCNDCHGSHDIQTSDSPGSPIYRRNVYKTCGKCHTKVEDVYVESIHGKLVEEGDKRGPVCTDCHESHRIISPQTLAFKRYSDERCGHCHEGQLERYRETFHGKAMFLGATDVASCADCHGYHDIVASEDPASPINPENRLETCRKCHPDANEGLTSYIAHAHHLDKENHPQLYWTFLVMTILLVSVFLFFGFHTLLWVARSLALYIRDSRTFRELKVKVKKDELVYSRFSPLERVLHILLMISFLILVLTGIPLKFYWTGWAQGLMSMLGGVPIAGYLHRSAALILVGLFLIHVVSLVHGLWQNRAKLRDPESGKITFGSLKAYMFRPDSMIPGWHDVRDFWRHQKWFFGKGERPQFDRWTYWEKFDYFAVFWGVFIIGISGLMMWIPSVFTTFLPGWMINVALIIHSDEALLAAGFIFTFHFFNVHFRIEKFPMDTVIFSGKVSKAELLEERKAWFDRLFATGKLEELRGGDEWEKWRPIAKTVGFIAFGTGVLLAVAIFGAMIFRLIAS